MRCTLVVKKIVDQSDVVGALPVILDLTPGFNGLGKYNCKGRRETSKFWGLCVLYQRFDSIHRKANLNFVPVPKVDDFSFFYVIS